jgi:hypothetical protein
LTAAVTNLFGASTANIWLAGPQSVDDSDATEKDGDS